MFLLCVIHAAENGLNAAGDIFAKTVCIPIYLHYKFARRRKNQRARNSVMMFFMKRMFKEMCQYRNQIGCCFSGSCLCLRRNVVSPQRLNQRLCLNRSAILKFKIVNSMHNFMGKLEIVKTCFSVDDRYFENRTIPRFERSGWNCRRSRDFWDAVC